MNKKNIISVIYFLSILIPGSICYSQNSGYSDSIKILFYNVENLFDNYNDSLTYDGEFTPKGAKNWTAKKLDAKTNDIFKTIIATGGWQPPAIIGLGEIENNYVLKKIIYDTPLSKYQYGFTHKNSPDKRGIDVAMLYDKKRIKIINSIAYKIKMPDNKNFITRDILYAKCLIKKIDTLHIFINHWPSRRGGIANSEFKRIFVSNVLKSKTDSILKTNKNANIIMMGDFNDNPDNKSLSLYNNKTYLNLAYSLYKKGQGTCKYKGNWFMFDQFIISNNLFNISNINCNKMNIAKHQFLIEKDNLYTGTKPFRTFYGNKYNGGISDHLPIFINVYFK